MGEANPKQPHNKKRSI